MSMLTTTCYWDESTRGLLFENLIRAPHSGQSPTHQHRPPAAPLSHLPPTPHFFLIDKHPSPIQKTADQAQ